MMLALRSGAFRALSTSPFTIAAPTRSFSSITRKAFKPESRLPILLSQRRGLSATFFRSIDTATENDQPDQSASVRDLPRDGSVNPSSSGVSTKEPTRAVYVGNLLFDITEEDLRKEFGRFGNVESTKIIYDSRGLSKGFGYVEYDSFEGAKAAITELNGQNFEGRRLAVDYVLKPAPRASAEQNPPSKTLYIGNMSFEMSAKDLDVLFRDIKNVIDVRVAIDRRTGQPRGFAHADFLSIEAAEAAYEILQNKEVHGRELKVDYSMRSREGRKMGE